MAIFCYASFMILYIDTSDNEKITLILFKEGREFKKQIKVSNKLSEVLLEEVQKFFQKTKVTFAKLQKVAVVVGPGHFSRIRTGVILANTLGFSLNIPVVGVKKGESLDFKKIFGKKGEKMVKPMYDQTPNITKPAKNKLKNIISNLKR